MVYPILLIGSTADCDKLLQEVNVDKGRLNVRLTAMRQQRIEEELNDTDPVRERQKTSDELALLQKQLEDELSQSSRAEMELRILRHQLRIKTLDRQIKNNGPIAQNMDILETVRLEAEMKVIEDFIGELLAHRDYLAANSPGADADADVGNDA